MNSVGYGDDEQSMASISILSLSQMMNHNLRDGGIEKSIVEKLLASQLTLPSIICHNRNPLLILELM